MAIQFREVLESEITKNLLPDNSFLTKARNDKQWVSQDKVFLPQRTGNLPKVEINRKKVPAEIKDTQHDIKTYFLNEFSTEPTRIQKNEQIVVNVDLRRMLREDMNDALSQEFARYVLQAWATTGSTGLISNGGSNQVLTTGSARDVIESGLTGQRKAITEADIIKLQQVMNFRNIPMKDRHLMVTAQQMGDLEGIDNFHAADTLGTSRNSLVEGFIGRIAGFDVILRSVTGLYSADGATLREFDAATLATDSPYAFAWHPRFVRQAFGSVSTFQDLNSATMYGDVFSMIARFGAMRARLDQAGVFSLIEGT